MYFDNSLRSLRPSVASTEVLRNKCHDLRYGIGREMAPGGPARVVKKPLSFQRRAVPPSRRVRRRPPQVTNGLTRGQASSACPGLYDTNMCLLPRTCAGLSDVTTREKRSRVTGVLELSLASHVARVEYFRKSEGERLPMNNSTFCPNSGSCRLFGTCSLVSSQTPHLQVYRTSEPDPSRICPPSQNCVGWRPLLGTLLGPRQNELLQLCST